MRYVLYQWLGISLCLISFSVFGQAKKSIELGGKLACDVTTNSSLEKLISDVSEIDNHTGSCPSNLSANDLAIIADIQRDLNKIHNDKVESYQQKVSKVLTLYEGNLSNNAKRAIIGIYYKKRFDSYAHVSVSYTH